MNKLQSSWAPRPATLNIASTNFAQRMVSKAGTTLSILRLPLLTLVCLSLYLLTTVTGPNKSVTQAQNTITPCANGRARNAAGDCPAMPKCATQCSFRHGAVPYCPNYWTKIQTGVDKLGHPIYNWVVKGYQDQREPQTNLPCAWEK